MATLVFDFDSTLVSVEGLDELFARSLEGAPDRAEKVRAFKEITDAGMAGELGATESLARRLSVLEADRGMVERVAGEIRERLSPSVERNLAFFVANADRIFVVSGGFVELILPALERIGIDGARLHAHRFRFDDEDRVIGVDPGTPLALGGKAAALEILRSEPGPVWIVGDGATDLELRTLGLADRFVAFTENQHRDPVVDRADHIARSMEELINLLECL